MTMTTPTTELQAQAERELIDAAQTLILEHGYTMSELDDLLTIAKDDTE